MYRVTLLSWVDIYLADAWSLPPIALLPNCPLGNSRLMLFDPMKFYAIATIVI